MSRLNVGIVPGGRTPREIAGLILQSLTHRRKIVAMEGRLEKQDSALAETDLIFLRDHGYIELQGMPARWSRHFADH